MEELTDELEFMVEVGIQNIENAISLAESHPLALKIKRLVIERLDSHIKTEFTL